MPWTMDKTHENHTQSCGAKLLSFLEASNRPLTTSNSLFSFHAPSPRDRARRVIPSSHAWSDVPLAESLPYTISILLEIMPGRQKRQSKQKNPQLDR